MQNKKSRRGDIRHYKWEGEEVKKNVGRAFSDFGERRGGGKLRTSRGLSLGTV